MPKNIIVLSDGTGNNSAKHFKTNVWRTYEALDLSDPTKQIAYYSEGVGNSPIKYLELLGGAIGLGLSQKVRKLYAYLCRNYEPGDRIYGFGFSRGAFTVRILAGFVAKFGLLKRDAFLGERDLWKKTTWLYRAYRKQHCGNGITPVLAMVVRGLRDLLPGQAMDIKNYQSRLDQGVNIEFLGLWDTVDAYGLPIEEMRVGWDRFVWPLSLRNRDLPNQVKKAVHALSLDDERSSFHPLLWNETGDSGVKDLTTVVRQDDKAKRIKDERLSQVWFSGMHSDVGGGYPDDYLSYVPLNWVLSQVGPHIIFEKAKRFEYSELARISGIMHDSRHGFGSYYRLQPRKLQELISTRRASLELSASLVPKLVSDNVVEIVRPKIHHSVFDRISTSELGYAPIVLPEKYAVVLPNGRIANLDQNTFETEVSAQLRARAQERVWDLVWWRRIAYFSTLVTSLYLALLPWLAPAPPGSCVGPLCVLSKYIELAGTFVPTLIGGWIGTISPAFVSRWVMTASANPDLLMFLAFFIIVLMRLNMMLVARTNALMSTALHSPQTLNATFSWLHSFRESYFNRLSSRAITKHFLPILFGFISLAGIALFSISGMSQMVFATAESLGKFCVVNVATQPSAITGLYSHRLEFDPSDECWSSGLAVEKGSTYRVVLNISDSFGSWKDDNLEADLLGNMENHSILKSILAWPSKRYLWENYYKPIARIRTYSREATGQDEYVLNPTFESSRKRYDCLVSDFAARTSGELFLFVNDAIIYFRPNGIVRTYDNNNGKAEVYVKRIARIGEPFTLPLEMAYTSACKEFVYEPPICSSYCDRSGPRAD